MNVYYNFTITGGAPFDQGMLNDLQNAILECEQAIGALAGPLVILSGCAVAGGNAANGLVAINGKIMPFVGGAVGEYVIIVSAETDLTYANGDTPGSEITQYATFGNVEGANYAWASFVSATTEGFLADIDSLNTDVATLGADITNIESTMVVKMASGNYNIGNVPVPGETYTIDFTTAVANTNYMVLLTPVSTGDGTAYDNTFVVIGKTVNGFTVRVNQPVTESEGFSFDWLVISF